MLLPSVIKNVILRSGIISIIESHMICFTMTVEGNSKVMMLYPDLQYYDHNKYRLILKLSCKYCLSDEVCSYLV